MGKKSLIQTGFKDIFFKQMFFFLGILLCINIIGSILYGNTTKSVAAKAIQYNRYKTQSFLNSMERDIEDIQQIQDELTVNMDFQKIIFNPEINMFDQYKTIWNVQDKLNTMNISSYVQSAQADIPSLGLDIGTNTSSIKNREAVYSYYKGKNYFDNSLLSIIDNQLFMVQTLPANSIPGNANNRLSVIIKLSPDKITQELNTFAANGDLCYLLWEDEGFIIMPKYEYITQMDALRIARQMDGKNEFDNLKVGNSVYNVICEESTGIGAKLFYFTNDSNSGISVKIQYWLWIFFSVNILFAFMFFFISSRLIKRPLTHLTKGLSEIENGNYSVRLTRNVNDNIAYIYISFNRMAAEIQRLIEKEYKQRLMAQEAHLQYLQAQIKPHFLYNCFFNMQTLLEMEKYEQLDMFINNLGQFYRYIHDNWMGNSTLMEEATHAYHYTEIQKLRFSPSVAVDFGNVPESWKSVKVPYLILQPLIENSFEHGFKKREGDCALFIRFVERGSSLDIEVQDNGFGMDDDNYLQCVERLNDDSIEDSDGCTLVNIHKRLILFGHGGLRLFNRRGQGFTAVVTVLREGEHDIQTVGG